jgi:hypothetical protein
MSLRSAAAALLLVAVFVVAQWSDLIMITYYNATPVKMCALDAPARCVYVIKPNMTLYDPNKTSIFWMYYNPKTSPPTWIYGGSAPNTALLQALYYNTGQKPSLSVDIPLAGYIYSSYSFYLDGRSADKLTICGINNYYFTPVSAGIHTLTSFTPPVYFLVPKTCTSYLLAGLTSNVVNATMPWGLVYVIHMPTARRLLSATQINGTAHIYNVNINGGSIGDLWPVGRGVYLGNGTYLPTIATSAGYKLDKWLWYGPVPHANFSSLGLSSRAVWFYTIGPSPSDGVALIRPPLKMRELAYIAEGSAGYLIFDSPYAYVTQFDSILSGSPQKSVVIYAQRYSLVEVAVNNGTHIFNARTLACPAYTTTPPLVVAFVYSISKELELCNNRTDTIYVVLYVNGKDYFNFIDRLDPGQCRRVRFDGTLSSSNIIYYFYSDAKTLCNKASGLQGALFSVSGLAPWFRYYVFSNNTVKQGGTILADYDYGVAWSNLTMLLARLYNSTLNALKQILQQTNATQALQSFIASQPHVTGAIKVDSATSTWLKTTLNVLQKYQTVGSSASFGAVSLPAVPTAVAPAAATAVAVAWAASRRDDDVATTAAVAGIALALFGILMTLIYGTSSLTLVALGVIVAAAAAAWRRIT